MDTFWNSGDYFHSIYVLFSTIFRCFWPYSFHYPYNSELCWLVSFITPLNVFHLDINQVSLQIESCGTVLSFCVFNQPMISILFLHKSNEKCLKSKLASNLLLHSSFFWYRFGCVSSQEFLNVFLKSSCSKFSFKKRRLFNKSAKVSNWL